MTIRPALPADFDAIWAILEPMIRLGETYCLPRDMEREAALGYWFSPNNRVFVAEAGGEALGTYLLRVNQLGGGSHVANCGYVTATWATGKGVARTMCLHSIDYAREHGFRAMQFNFVVSSNARAVKLWEGLGFGIVGRLEQAFLHPTLGFVDAYVMVRNL